MRKLAEEKNVPAAAIQPSGKDGRATKADVMAALSSISAQPAPPARPAAPSGPRLRADREERVKMTRLRRTIANRLKEAQNTAAMLTTFNEVDMTNVMALRDRLKDDFEKKHGARLGFMSFFVKACIAALKELPAVNAEIEGDDLVYKNYYDIGVAVGTPNGLVVPVLRDADELSFGGIEKGIAEGATLALDGRGFKHPKHPDGYFLGPTLFTDVKPDMVIAQEEIFGPVLCVMKADSFDQAIDIVKAHDLGNASSIFTSSGKAAREYRYRVAIEWCRPTENGMFMSGGRFLSKLENDE